MSNADQITQMVNDAERIIHLFVGEHLCFSAQVELRGSVFSQVEAIIPYWENGEMAQVPWFALMRKRTSDGALVVVDRINAAFVSRVEYKR